MSVATPRVLVVSESRITRRVVEMTFADQPLQLAVVSPPAASPRTTGDAAAGVAAWPTSRMQAHRRLRAGAQLRAHPAGRRRSVMLLAGQTESIDEAGGGRGAGLGGAAQAARLASAGRRGAPGAAVGPPPGPPRPRRCRCLPPRRRRAGPGRRHRAGDRSGQPAAVPDVAAVTGSASMPMPPRRPSNRRRRSGWRRTRRHVPRPARSGAGPPARTRRRRRSTTTEVERDRDARRGAGRHRSSLTARLESAIVDRTAPPAAAAAERAAGAPDTQRWSPMSSSGWSASWRRRWSNRWRAPWCATRSPGCAARARVA